MKISEVSNFCELSQDTLRYYERIGLIPPVHRNQSGIREFTEEDCKWAEFIKCMRAAGLPIDVLSEYVKMYMEGDKTLLKRKALVVDQRKLLLERMAEMQVTLDRLDKKIERYDRLVIGKEKQLPRPLDRLDVDQL